MNTGKLANALNTISLAFGELAEALIEQPGSVAVSPPVSSPVPADLPPSFDELPWEEAEPADPVPAILAATGGTDVTWTAPETLAATPQSERDRVLAECPVHFRPWTIREGGISRNGRHYSAFWKCNGKNADGSFCTKKPEAGWVKTHNAEKALAASAV